MRNQTSYFESYRTQEIGRHIVNTLDICWDWGATWKGSQRWTLSKSHGACFASRTKRCPIRQQFACPTLFRCINSRILRVVRFAEHPPPPVAKILKNTVGEHLVFAGRGCLEPPQARRWSLSRTPCTTTVSPIGQYIRSSLERRRRRTSAKTTGGM